MNCECVPWQDRDRVDLAMKLLTTPRELSTALLKLMRDYDRFYWAVAWASIDFPAYDYLRRHTKKAKMIAVGTHFYQTHPDFIEQFRLEKAFRFFFDAASLEGTYHPKAFLFEKRNGQRAAIIGSANFTAAAFGKNVEICSIIEERDRGSSELLQSLRLQIQQLWISAAEFPKDQLLAYRDRWKRRRQGLVEGRLFRDQKTNLLDVRLLVASWEALYAEMKRTRHFRARLKMLGDIHEFFNASVPFRELSPEQRQKVAGTFRDEPETKWRLFGSMQGAIDFKERLKSNRREISRALDFIPWEGAVTRDHYQRFKIEFCKLFVYSREFRGVAVPSRLLAMKRPDYFLCIDRPNRRRLASMLGIPMSRITFDSYWDIIEELADTPWWNSSEPMNEEERQSWLARVAMLDSLFYKA